jgi:hypothetical protein
MSEPINGIGSSFGHWPHPIGDEETQNPSSTGDASAADDAAETCITMAPSIDLPESQLARPDPEQLVQSPYLETGSRLLIEMHQADQSDDAKPDRPPAPPTGQPAPQEDPTKVAFGSAPMPGSRIGFGFWRA